MINCHWDKQLPEELLQELAWLTYEHNRLWSWKPLHLLDDEDRQVTLVWPYGEKGWEWRSGMRSVWSGALSVNRQTPHESWGDTLHKDFQFSRLDKQAILRRLQLTQVNKEPTFQDDDDDDGDSSGDDDDDDDGYSDWSCICTYACLN